MRLKSLLLASVILTCAPAAFADLTPWKDYEVSEQVWVVTTVKVKRNMQDAYLEGLKRTWIPGVEIQKELGYIEDYAIYRSDLPGSGDFNLMLVVRFSNSEALAPSKQRYEAFMDEFGQDMAEETTEYSQANYPGMREITGEYMMREITIK